MAKASQEETGQKAGEGVEIVRNEPFDEKSEINRYNMPPGQYTCVFASLSSLLFLLRG